MHNKYNHACSQKPVYPSYILSYTSLPSMFYLSSLSPQFLPSYSCHILPITPYPAKETIMPHNTLHNNVDKTTYKLSRIPLSSTNVLKIGQLPLECIDAHKGCDFDIIAFGEQYKFLNFNQLCSSFPLSESQIPTNEPILQIALILIIGLISMLVYINHSLSNIKTYAFLIPQMCSLIVQDIYLITFVLMHIDFWRPMVTLHIHHILVDLKPIID
jgi:hypothetical protein